VTKPKIELKKNVKQFLIQRFLHESEKKSVFDSIEEPKNID
jgi:hypothetical protein